MVLAQKILTLTVKKFISFYTNLPWYDVGNRKYFVADLYLLQVSVMICILIQHVEFYQDSVLQRQHHVHPWVPTERRGLPRPLVSENKMTDSCFFPVTHRDCLSYFSKPNTPLMSLLCFWLHWIIHWVVLSSYSYKSQMKSIFDMRA